MSNDGVYSIIGLGIKRRNRHVLGGGNVPGRSSLDSIGGSVINSTVQRGHLVLGGEPSHQRRLADSGGGGSGSRILVHRGGGGVEGVCWHGSWLEAGGNSPIQDSVVHRDCLVDRYLLGAGVDLHLVRSLDLGLRRRLAAKVLPVDVAVLHEGPLVIFSGTLRTFVYGLTGLYLIEQSSLRVSGTGMSFLVEVASDQLSFVGEAHDEHNNRKDHLDEGAG